MVLKDEKIKDYENRLKLLIEKGDYPAISQLLVDSFLDNPQNIYLIKYIEKDFLDSKLDKELVELYQLAFYYTSDFLYLEKTGDVYLHLKDYEAAINAYLNCAEVSVNYASIYKKMANVFELLDDKASMQTCLEQYKLLKK